MLEDHIGFVRFSAVYVYLLYNAWMEPNDYRLVLVEKEAQTSKQLTQVLGISQQFCEVLCDI